MIAKTWHDATYKAGQRSHYFDRDERVGVQFRQFKKKASPRAEIASLRAL